MKIRPVGAELFHVDGRTDGRTDTIIINVKDWTLWPVLSPKLQLFSPTFRRSSNWSSLWSIVVRFQRDSVLWHSLQVLKVGIKDWYWPQRLLSMPIDNIHKSWENPSDMSSVSSASKSDFHASSLVISGQCSFSCSGDERMKASSRRLKTETFG